MTVLYCTCTNNKQTHGDADEDLAGDNDAEDANLWDDTDLADDSDKKYHKSVIIINGNRGWYVYRWLEYKYCTCQFNFLDMSRAQSSHQVLNVASEIVSSEILSG